MTAVGVRTGGLDVVRCPSCRLVRVDGEPDATEIDSLYSDAATYAAYVDSQRHDDLIVRYDRTLGRLSQLVARRDAPFRVFDVGAGSGRFLARARDAGFLVSGNELSLPAIELCRERYGIDLDRDLRGGTSHVDAVTMWCVIAHVSDPHQLLCDVRARLTVGGVLYLHTPRWSALDVIGFGLSRLTAGRVNRLVERRINTAHLRLYTRKNMSSALRAAGFEPVSIEPAAELSLNTASYLTSLGFPSRAIGQLSRAIDVLLRRGLAPRNILNVYATVPASPIAAADRATGPEPVA